LHQVIQNRECCISFAFSTFLGNMIFYDKSKELSNIVNCITNDRVGELTELLSSERYVAQRIEIFNEPETSNKLYCTDELNKFFLQSENLLREKISLFLLQNTITVIDGDEIAVCNQEFGGGIIASSLRYLRVTLNSCINKRQG
ncbi:hypothetical protein, partial [Candidatus Ichthyocystis hellenicum]|uniref:hypothetical protein n=2 Tax=Candidatus Ichthyocystis TaxID=2929841 RepID=UPI001F5F597A